MNQVLADENGSGTVSWLLADNQATIRDVVQYNSGTDATTVVDHLEYNAFGVIMSQTNSAYQPIFAYTGQMWDAAAGLYYYHARWYDATTGRFISQDPTGFAAGDPNLYRYVANAPTNSVDPTGKSFLGDIGLMLQYPGDALSGAATGAAHGGAMVANAATAGLITPLNDEVNNLIEQNGGAYAVANMAANIGVGAATAALPCGLLANGFRAINAAAGMKDIITGAAMGDEMKVMAGLFAVVTAMMGTGRCFVAGTQVVVGVKTDELAADSRSDVIDVGAGIELGGYSTIICVGIGVAGFIALQPATANARRGNSRKGRSAKRRREFDELFDGQDFTLLNNGEGGHEREEQPAIEAHLGHLCGTIHSSRKARMDRRIIFEFTNIENNRFPAMPIEPASARGNVRTILRGVSSDRAPNTDTRASGLVGSSARVPGVAGEAAVAVAERLSFATRLKPVVREAQRRDSEPKFRKLVSLRWAWLAACLVVAALWGFDRSGGRR
ncbi:MAG TPA: RHS repeat-associated core domain-containing protein, partial [Planctomycetaceae bacterium]